jgi:diguanylate cyclase (GGDEF)-like protein
MEHASAAARAVRPIDAGLLAAAAQRAADEIGPIDEPGRAIEAAIEAFYEAVAGVMPSVFVLEHGRLWLVAQRGYAVVPDGITVDSGVTGRAVRSARPQLVPDVGVDADYVAALPGVISELAIPLRVERSVIGVLNVESERSLPDGAADAIRPLARALAPLADALRTRRTLDLAGLARLFVHLGSLRDPETIAALGAASLPKVLPVETAQLLLWGEGGAIDELAVWRAEDEDHAPLSDEETVRARAEVDPTVVCHVLDFSDRAAGSTRSVVWLPLRANAGELGALAGVSTHPSHVDPALLDTAAVLAAHVAASLDASVSLERERRSAATDPLTGVLNRRGFEQALESALDAAREDRRSLSLLVIDCDDFKEINDRAGHEFGDSLLREVADALVGALPDGAEAARLGGDEFVVMLPDADVDAALAIGTQIRQLLAEGLTDAGFPLRISAGISTYPIDGAKATALLRAGDQALYAAKSAGKDRIATFREVMGATTPSLTDGQSASEALRRGRTGTTGTILADTMAAVSALETEVTASAVCDRLCKALVFVVGATACQASRVLGEYVVDANEHALREVRLGEGVAYRISDFPLTEEVLRTREPRALSFADGTVEPSEAFVLRDLGMNALLMLPLYVRGVAWGLVELYEMRMRRFTEDDIAVARFLATQAERRLEVVAGLDDAPTAQRVYKLPDDSSRARFPRTR